jgi:hypothetical protein
MTRYICEGCWAIDHPRMELRGSFAIELMLWLLLVVPGIAYARWRGRGGYPVCRRCGSSSVVSEESAQGRSLLASIPHLPAEQQTAVQAARAFVTFVPLVGGVGIVVLLTISALFPGVRDSAWLRAAVVLAAAAILAHPVWSVLHLALRAAQAEEAAAKRGRTTTEAGAVEQRAAPDDVRDA